MVGDDEVPYEWPPESVVPREVLQLWTEVENGLEKNQTGTVFTLHGHTRQKNVPPFQGRSTIEHFNNSNAP